MIVPAGEERIRGGVAKRYRYDADRDRDQRTLPPRTADAERGRSSPRSANELIRRTAEARLAGAQALMADAELWVDPEVWREIRDRIVAGRPDLHAAAQPAAHPRHDPHQHHRRDVPDGDRADERETLAPLRIRSVPVPARRAHDQRAGQRLRPDRAGLRGPRPDRLGRRPGPGGRRPDAGQRRLPALRRGARRPAAEEPADGRLQRRRGRSPRARSPRWCSPAPRRSRC